MIKSKIQLSNTIMKKYIKNFKQTFLHPLKMQWYEIQIKRMGAWNLFLKQQTNNENEIVLQHYNSTNILHPDNSIIFMCNGFIWSGGLADRLRAIIAIYGWCKNNNRQFKINFTTPFILQNYLVPRNYDWIPSNISYNKTETVVKVCLLEPRTCNRPEIFPRLSELGQDWCNNNLNIQDKQIHVFSNLFNWNENFSQLFNELFKPCERIEKEINYHLSQINGQYISISFRFTTLLGDFKDCTGKPLCDNEKENLIKQSLLAIQKISEQAPAHDKILVTADSITFLNRITGLPNIYVIPGKIGHIDYESGDDVNMKTFLDFFMISKAEAVYLAKGPGMYKSAFAKTASLVNNKPFKIYEY